MNVSDPLTTAWLDTSDWGNAKRLVTIAGGKLLWIEELQAWAHYDGRRWSLERGNIEAQRLAHRVIEHIDLEAEALGEIAEDWCADQGSARRLVHARDRREAGRGAARPRRAIGQRRHDLGHAEAGAIVPVGLDRRIRRRSARLQRAQRHAALRRRTRAAWRVRRDARSRRHADADRQRRISPEGATARSGRERLAMLTPDPEQLAAFKPLYGYTLTGLTSDQAFYVHQGVGGDGKSATHMALADLHGDYYRHAGVKTFLQGKPTAAAPSIAATWCG
jgi:putative DNA primase/helicase